MRQLRPMVASLTLILLLPGWASLRAQEVSKVPEPEIGFLEFLGSVDRLSDLMPDYLSQPELGAKASTGSTPAPPPPQRPPQPPSAPPNGSGGHNNG